MWSFINCYNNNNTNCVNISASSSYIAGVFYVYSKKNDAQKVINKLPIRTAGTIIGSIVMTIGLGTYISYNHFVETPLREQALVCESCSLTRGAGIGAVFTGIGMLSVSSVHAYQYVPDKRFLKLTRHSLNSLTGSVYGCVLLLIGSFCGMAITNKLISELKSAKS